MMHAPLLYGRLGPIAVQDVMSFLATLRLDGLFVVETDAAEVGLLYGGGRIEAVEVCRGAVDVSEILARVPGVEPDLRRRLLVGGDAARTLATRLADAEAPDGIARRILVEELLVVMAALAEWPEATFQFSERTGSEQVAYPLGLEVQELLLETARRSDEWGLLPEIYGNPEMRFEMLAEPGEDDEKISLGLEEWRILYLVSNRASIAEIRAASGHESELKVSQILFTLASAGLIRPLETLEAEDGLVDDGAPVGFTGAIDLGSIDLPTEAEGAGPTSGISVADFTEGLAPDATAPRPAPRWDVEPVSRRPPSTREETGAILSSLTGARRLTRVQIRVERRARLRRLRPEDGDLPEVVDLDTPELTIGRKADNDLRLQNTHVSGHHARILSESGRFVLEDVGSVNGMAVDGKGRKRAVLRGGEEIEIYPFLFRFEVEFDIDGPEDEDSAAE